MALERRDPVKLLWKRIALLFVFILAIAAGSGVWDAYQKERSSRLLREDAERHEAHLLRQEAELHDDIAELTTERGKEAALRQEYNVGRSGEGLIILVDPPQPEPIEATSTGFRAMVHKFLPFW